MGAVHEQLRRPRIVDRIADVVGRTRAGWVTSALGSALVFGLGHLYLGGAGAVSAVMGGLVAVVLYLTVFRRNPWPLVAVHVLVEAAMFAAVHAGVLA
ncbi:MAG: CPBP family intramembrane glutamic endopeptidase [Kineosporiaceae bacterium]